jgi:glycosyltransferase involved in cell wall biosynthesis
MGHVPEISVVIPTRDRWETLRRSALRAALMQEDVSMEVVVVDDGSTDGTHAGLLSLDAAQLRVVRHDVARGVSAARNTGIELARGEWLAFLDDDDFWSPRKLRSQIDLGAREGAGFVFSSAVIVDRDRRPIAHSSVPEDEDLVGLLSRRNVVPGGCSNLIARAELVRRLGAFDERLSMLADWDLWLRLAHESSGSRCREIHVAYLQHEGNMALRTPQRVFRESAHFAAKHGRAVPGRQLFDRRAAIRWVGWENFWVGNRFRAARLLMRAGITERSWPDFRRGLQFLVWAGAPDAVSRAFWRLRHGVDASAVPELPVVDWLSRYDIAEHGYGETAGVGAC